MKTFAISAPITLRSRRPGRRPRLRHPMRWRRPAKSLPCSTAAGHAIPTITPVIGPRRRLAGQREDVLLKALRDFKTGVRLSSGVASMADVTYDLNDSDMQALAHYMAMHP